MKKTYALKLTAAQIKLLDTDSTGSTFATVVGTQDRTILEFKNKELISFDDENLKLNTKVYFDENGNIVKVVEPAIEKTIAPKKTTGVGSSFIKRSLF